MIISKKATGNRGEQIARNYLEKHGYQILTTNWRCQQGEIDIVAQSGQILIFVEVRTRSTTTENAFESVHLSKRERMIAAAFRYLQSNNLPEETAWRVDIIAVVTKRGCAPIVEHVENALDW